MNTLISNNRTLPLHRKNNPVSFNSKLHTILLNSFVDVILPLLRIKVRKTGEFPKTGPYLIIANHNSHADTPILIKAMKRIQRNKCKVIASKEYFFDSNKLSRKFARAIFPLEPATASNALHSIERVKKEENVLIMYPEGTRGLTSHMNTFKPGVKKMLETSGIPVVPVAIKGSRLILKPESCIPRSGEVTVHIGKPILPSEFNDSIVETLESEVQKLYNQ